MRSAGAPFITTDPVGAQRVALAELLVAAAEGRVRIGISLTPGRHRDERWDVQLIVDPPQVPIGTGEDGDTSEDER